MSDTQAQVGNAAGKTISDRVAALEEFARKIVEVLRRPGAIFDVPDAPPEVAQEELPLPKAHVEQTQVGGKRK